MKKFPKIILIRHAESVRNAISPELEVGIPSYAYGLSPLGRQQALAAGRRLVHILNPGRVHFEVSDYARTRLTLQGILQGLPASCEYRVRLNPLVRERERGDSNAERFDVEVSPFYLQTDASGVAETCVRMSDRAALFWTQVRMEMFAGTLPENLVVVSHNQFLCSLIMHIYGVGHIGFQKLEEIANTQMIVLEPDAEGNYDSEDPYLAGVRHFRQEIVQHIQGMPNVAIAPCST